MIFYDLDRHLSNVGVVAPAVRRLHRCAVPSPGGTTPQMNLEDFQGVPLREWIAQDATRREIKRRFQSFLLTFQVWSPT